MAAVPIPSAQDPPPYPTHVELEDYDGNAEDCLPTPDTEPIRMQDDNDPPSVQVPEEIVYVRFGSAADGNTWDTLCIIFESKKIHLENHTEFDKCLGAQLTTSAAESVEIIDIPGKGLGMVAVRDIPRGQTFLLERPLLMCMRATSPGFPSNFHMMIDEGMDKEHKDAYFNLHDCKTKVSGELDALGILRTNTRTAKLPFDDHTQSCVYKLFSRVNHSCIPNATYDWNIEDFTGGLRCTAPIQKGEEITISYTAVLAPACTRKAALRKKYAFDCTCPACSLPPARQTKSDERRVALAGRIAPNPKTKRFDLNIIETGYDDAYIMDTLNMCDAEGLSEERATLLALFADLESRRARLNGNYARAGELAKRAVKEMKKMGKHEFWRQMEAILEEKKIADEKPQMDITKSMKDISVEELAESFSMGAELGMHKFTKFLNASREEQQKLKERYLEGVQNMMMGGIGIQAKRTDVPEAAGKKATRNGSKNKK